MKIKTPKAKFVPVSIVLESQEEVDKIFAIFNFCPISERLNLPESAWLILRRLKTEGYQKYHDKLGKAY